MKKVQYFSADILEFLSIPSKYDVRYLIVGGEAVIYYGHARLTGDIDVFYEAKTTNAQNLFVALNEFWHNDIPGVKSADELLKNGIVCQFGIPPNRIDLLSVVDGVKFDAAWKRRTTQSQQLRRKSFIANYIGLDDLISNKRAVGRPRDKEDLKFLNELKQRQQKELPQRRK